MKKLQLTILTQEELEKWYDKLKNTNMARFTNEAIADGFSIVDYDKLYFSFKTKSGVQIAHSLSGCDSEGFIYNC